MNTIFPNPPATTTPISTKVASGGSTLTGNVTHAFNFGGLADVWGVTLTQPQLMPDGDVLGAGNFIPFVYPAGSDLAGEDRYAAKLEGKNITLQNGVYSLFQFPSGARAWGYFVNLPSA